MAEYPEKIEEKRFYVIGAGLPRTGTLSLMYALEILLPGKCYHGLKAVHHEKEWCDIMEGKYTDAEYREFILSNDYIAGLDSPFCYEYERAMKVFPEAKVVLTIRDPDSWVRSLSETVMCTFSSIYLPAFMFSYLFPEYLTRWSPDDQLRGWSRNLCNAASGNHVIGGLLKAYYDGTGADFFRRWTKEVEGSVPPEKLLKFHVGEGWEPLCRHLGVPVPDVPFPKVNNSATLGFYLRRNIRRGWVLLYEFVSIPLLAYGVFKLSQRY